MKKFAIALLTVLSLGILTACGPGAGGGGGAAGEPITVQMGPGFKFEPATLELEAGKQYAITVNNVDTQAHNFVIEGTNVRTANVAGGKSATISYTPAASGTVTFICDVPGHSAQMRGTINVR